jgi:hypothetical protein
VSERRADASERPEDAEARGLAILADASRSIRSGVAREVPAWVVRAVDRILDAWGRADAATRDRALGDARTAGDAAATRVGVALGVLLDADPADQHSTPLEVVRTVYREPTQILRDAGVPAIVRDEFDERAWPDDVYGLVPRTFGDLGDDDLAPLLLVWGTAKATILRARAAGKAP